MIISKLDSENFSHLVCFSYATEICTIGVFNKEGKRATERHGLKGSRMDDLWWVVWKIGRECDDCEMRLVLFCTSMFSVLYCTFADPSLLKRQ